MSQQRSRPIPMEAAHGRSPRETVANLFDHATELARRGSVPQAVQLYRELLAWSPDFPPAHANLALLLNLQHAFSDAEPHFRCALAVRPAAVPLLLGLAQALQRQSRWQEAEPYYRRVLVIRPERVEAWLGLGVCLRSASRLEEACECFERAAHMDPACVDAYFFASHLRRVRDGEQLLAQCEALQPRVATFPAIRQARYWFALAKMREDSGRYDAAFTAYAKGNRIRSSMFTLDESGEDEWLRRTCAAFTAAAPACQAPIAPGARVPVFVVGMPRSGTSLIEQVLATHPAVHGAGEITDFLDVLLHRLDQPGGWPEHATQLECSELRAMGNEYIERAWRHAPHATHVVNKTTLNYRFVGLIRMMLPQARIIHAVRDPMGSCFSCYTHLFDGDNLAYTYDLRSLGRYYVRYARLMRHWRRTLPDAVLDVHYESLVANLEPEARRMLDYLGLAWEPRCLEFHRNTRPVATASRAQVRRAIYTDAVARWKHFERHLAPLLECVAAWQ